jgi:hypothetical protein
MTKITDTAAAAAIGAATRELHLPTVRTDATPRHRRPVPVARPMGVVGGGDLGGAACASGTKPRKNPAHPAPSGRVPAARAAA